MVSVNSFGIAGTSAHIIIAISLKEVQPKSRSSVLPDYPALVILSANTTEPLKKHVRNNLTT